jgi:pimeloyl-ACP methyl ester carboxylesterase
VNALGYAASRCLPEKRGAERQALRAEALTLRGRMQLELAAWARAGLRVPAPLRPLTRGAGHDELAGDLLKLAAQLRRVHASGYTGILTSKEVAEAERLATECTAASHTTAAVTVGPASPGPATPWTPTRTTSRRSSTRSSSIAETNLTEDLKKFDVPTLVVHGDDDRIVPHRHVRTCSIPRRVVGPAGPASTTIP